MRTLLVTSLSLFTAAFLGQAATLGVTLSGGNTAVNTGTWTLGYSFQVNSAISVTALGVYDDGGDGLNVSHDVGLWDSSGNLLASTTVAAGTVDPLNGGFRFASISAVALSTGSVYYVGSVNGFDNDPWLVDATVNSAPEITYLSRQFEFSGGGLVFPDLVGSNTTGYWGGNFEFGSSQVPEPSTWALAAAALAGISVFKRRRMNSSR